MNFSVEYSTDTAAEILSLQDLSPGPTVNRLFGGLVQLVMQNQISISDFTELEIDDLRSRCATAEFLLEQYWANLISNGEARVSEFPYYSNYLELSMRELALIRMVEKETQEKEMLFVGSGPLPLSSIFFSNVGIRSTLLDISGEAIELSRGIVGALNPIFQSSFKFINENILNMNSSDLQDYDFIFLAALVGQSVHEKNSVLIHLSKNMRRGQYLIARSAEGNRAILYSPLDVDFLRSLGFELLHGYYPDQNIINSTLVFIKK